MREFLHNSIEPRQKFEPEPPNVKYIFAGYSWKYDRFYIWKLEYDKKENAYKFVTPQTLMKNKLAVLLDVSNHQKSKEESLTPNKIRKRIFEKMEEKGKKSGDGFDMEPFEVMRDIIRNNEDWSIGGTPQLVKVYRHMNTMPYGIFWPNKQSEQITFLGRPLLDYETLKFPIIDPDTFDLSYMKIDNENFQRIHDDGKFTRYREI